MALKNRLVQGLLMVTLYAFFEEYPVLDGLFPSGLFGTVLKIGTLFLVSVIGSYVILRALRPSHEQV